MSTPVHVKAVLTDPGAEVALWIALALRLAHCSLIQSRTLAVNDGVAQWKRLYRQPLTAAVQPASLDTGGVQR
jgi:hypothetical protein